MSFDKKKFLDIASLVNEEFYNFMSERSLFVSINSDEDIEYLGYGGFAAPDDNFKVFYSLVESPYPMSFSIFAQDRNGNFAIDGETVAIYSVDVTNITDQDLVIAAFKTLMEDIYEKYSVYSKENRLDFIFNEMTMERKEYSPKDPSKEPISDKIARAEKESGKDVKGDSERIEPVR